MQDMYQRFREKPPRARNQPPVYGAIAWARHLLNRIQMPMKSFQENKKLLESKDGRKIVKTYNKMIRIFVAFECVWFDAWAAQIEKAKAGLYATLIVRHPVNRKLYVNFDPGGARVQCVLTAAGRAAGDAPNPSTLWRLFPMATPLLLCPARNLATHSRSKVFASHANRDPGGRQDGYAPRSQVQELL